MELLEGLRRDHEGLRDQASAKVTQYPLVPQYRSTAVPAFYSSQVIYNCRIPAYNLSGQ